MSIFQFVEPAEGFVTEVNSVKFGQGLWKDVSNFQLGTKFWAKRRPAIDQETGYTATATTAETTPVMGDYEWVINTNTGKIIFTVVQLGTTLHFYDTTTNQDTINSNKKSFTFDLETKLASFAAAGDSGLFRIGADSGKNAFFVVSPVLNDFVLTYDSVGDSIAALDITPKIRDFDGVDDGLAIDERPVNVLSDTHNYNLINQGWTDERITAFNTGSPAAPDDLYPSNAEIWWNGKDNAGDFSFDQIEKLSFGNTRAPRGHFILSYYQMDRNTVSGIAGVSDSPRNHRAVDCLFHNGRLWRLMTNGDILFSRIIIDTLEDSAICYQEEDPTAEILNEIVDSDGGTVPANEIGQPLRLVRVSDTIYIVGSERITRISAQGGRFTATNLAQPEASTSGALSGRGVVVVNNALGFVANEGIILLTYNDIDSATSFNNITRGRIKEFYLSLTQEEKDNSRLHFDEKDNKIYFIYGDFGEKMLVGDTGANATDPKWTKYLVGVDTEDSTSPVIESVRFYTNPGSSTSPSRVKFFVKTLNSGTHAIAFCEFRESQLFTDYENLEPTKGSDPSAFIHTYYFSDQLISAEKRINFIETYMARTETSVVDGEADRPSSLLLSASWDWYDQSESHKNYILNQQQMYLPEQDNKIGSFGRNTIPQQEVVFSRLTVHGTGKSTQFIFEAEAGKDCIILGYSADFTQTA